MTGWIDTGLKDHPQGSTVPHLKLIGVDPKSRKIALELSEKLHAFAGDSGPGVYMIEDYRVLRLSSRRSRRDRCIDEGDSACRLIVPTRRRSLAQKILQMVCSPCICISRKLFGLSGRKSSLTERNERHQIRHVSLVVCWHHWIVPFNMGQITS